VQQYNAALRQLVGRYADSARLVDFHAACVEHLTAAAAVRATPAPPLAGLPSMSLWGMVWIQVAAVVRRYVFRSSWNAVSRVNRLRLLTDHVHLNDTAAALLVRSLQPFVDELIAGS
jgi:lysophospholipase L1-like esterase